MLERYLKQATFSSLEDFQKNFEFKVPADFNFACDVVDGWAEQAPDKLAMLWTNDKDEEIRYTFGQLKEESDRTASFFQSLGIGKRKYRQKCFGILGIFIYTLDIGKEGKLYVYLFSYSSLFSYS